MVTVRIDGEKKTYYDHGNEVPVYHPTDPSAIRYMSIAGVWVYTTTSEPIASFDFTYADPQPELVEEHDPLIVPAEMFDKEFADRGGKMSWVSCVRLEAEGLTTAYHTEQKRFWVRGEPKLARMRRHWTMQKGMHLIPDE